MIESGDDLDRAACREMSDGTQYHALGRGGPAWILNEAHGLKRDIIRRLVGILERLPAHCVVIFTTTKLGQKQLFEDQIDANPLLDRCIGVKRTNQGLAERLDKSGADQVSLTARIGPDGQHPKEALCRPERLSGGGIA